MSDSTPIEVLPVAALQVGMFVCRIDRPWLETPFLMQGFQIEGPRDLEELRRLCREVHVDWSRSTAEAREAAQRREGRPQPVAPQLHGRVGVASAWQPEPGTASFRDLLRGMRDESLLLGGRALDAAAAVARRSAGTQVPDGADPSQLDLHRLPQFNPLAWIGDLFARLRRRPGAALPKFDIPPMQREQIVTPPVVSVYVNAGPVEDELAASLPVFQKSRQVLREVIDDIRASRVPDMERVQDAVDGMVESVVRNPDALLWLSKLKRSDNYTYDHAIDVSVHMMLFGRHLGLARGDLDVLGVAGLMQDVGKLRCPPGLLTKAEALTQREHEQLREHVQHTMALLASDRNIRPEVLEVIRRHHERIDGSGYPYALRGDQIGLFGEMAGLVDSYCAMVAPRPYCAAMENQRALEQMYALRGHEFSESVVDQFIQCVGLYPVGTLVELNSGEVAVVIEQNRVRRMKPKVMVLLGPDKSPNRYPPTLDLISEPMVNEELAYRIVRALPPGAHGIDAREFYLL
jgi:HD-GYP domain-containing protein (c-di-GMP phosphodiesterase class II)